MISSIMFGFIHFLTSLTTMENGDFFIGMMQYVRMGIVLALI